VPADGREIDQEIQRIRARIAELEAERMQFEVELNRLVPQRAAPAQIDDRPILDGNSLPVTQASSITDKVTLFRRLFAGRIDVFPVRWENRKTAKSGYAPACSNEWVRGICGKPRVKCSECPHQAFIPVSDNMITRHLRGGDGFWRCLSAARG
jgi:hypothetical protein